VDPENSTIEYKAYIDEIEITNSNDLWIKFYPKERKFAGKASKNLYFNEYTIKVLATDGFSEASDSFTIKLNEMPFLLLI
jgi:hypothetical protein